MYAYVIYQALELKLLNMIIVYSQTRYTRIYLKCDPSVTGDVKFDVEGDSKGVILHYVRTPYYIELHESNCKF